MDPGRFIVVDLESCWRAMNERKKAFILQIFGITDDILVCAKQRSAVLFTQPLTVDCFIPEQELVRIYEKLLAGVAEDDLVIKPHPRDPVRYEEYFPGALVLRSCAPFQLLSALGMKFSTGITIFSSAISALPKDAKIVWGGSEVHPVIFQRFGHIDIGAFR